MKHFVYHLSNRIGEWAAVLAVLVVLVACPTLSGAESCGLSLGLFTEQTDPSFLLGTPIKILLVVKNTTGFAINTDKGFAQAELQRGLTLTTPSGELRRYVDEEQAFDMPPPFFINGMVGVPAETLPPGWVRTVTIQDLRDLFPIMKSTPGWYTIDAQQAFVRYAWTIDFGHVGILGVDSDARNCRETVASNSVQIYISPPAGAQLKVRVLAGLGPPPVPLGQVPVRVFGGAIAAQDYPAAWVEREPVLQGTTDFEGLAVWGTGAYCLVQPAIQYTALAFYENSYRAVAFPAVDQGWLPGCTSVIAGDILFASADITASIDLIQSGLIYNRRDQTSSMDVALKNTSPSAIAGPIRVVIESISDSRVAVVNADGTTDAGKPYFLYSLNGGELAPDQLSEAKRWVFANPYRARFTFSVTCLTP